MTEQSKKQPIHKINRGKIKVSIWQNQTKDGKNFYTFCLERSYQGAQENWQTEKVRLSLNESLVAAHALIKANADYYDLTQLSKSGDDQAA